MNTTQMPQMKVYVVIGGYNYEGEVFRSLRLFDCWSAADAYREELTTSQYDYTRMETREVNMESAIPSRPKTKKVYSVVVGVGESEVSHTERRLFDCKSDAQAYYQEVVDQDQYDYVLMETREVKVH